MNLTYEKKEAMTFIGYHTEIKPKTRGRLCQMSRVLGQGV